MNAKVLLLVIGLVIGAVAGWFFRPSVATIDAGPVQVQVDGASPAEGGNGLQQVLLFALIGGAIGLVVGFVVDRR